MNDKTNEFRNMIRVPLKETRMGFPSKTRHSVGALKLPRKPL